MTAPTSIDGLCIVRPWRVRVAGYEDSYVHYERSRQKALAASWRDYGCYVKQVPFRQFLQIASARMEPLGERFGELMWVGGKPAFYVSHNSQYIQFVRPDSDMVMNTHPYDVEPPEARRGTPYYVEPLDPPKLGAMREG